MTEEKDRLINRIGRTQIIPKESTSIELEKISVVSVQDEVDTAFVTPSGKNKLSNEEVFSNIQENLDNVLQNQQTILRHQTDMWVDLKSKRKMFEIKSKSTEKESNLVEKMSFCTVQCCILCTNFSILVVLITICVVVSYGLYLLYSYLTLNGTENRRFSISLEKTWIWNFQI